MIRNKKILLIIAIILIILLTGCNEKNKNDDLNEKVKQELDYIDIQTVSVLNKLNNITLRNYIITEEEIQNKDQSTTEKSGSGEKGQQNSQNEQKESDSQSSSDSKLEETNVTVTSMEPQSILALDETKIEWDVIRNKVETINEAWSIILLDLSNVNIDSNDILGFSNALNDTMISVKEENKTNTLINASKMYSYIPKY